ncbi:response regulator, partial [Myxococcota bacterium]|nr:response regulator [Myxococcota bacterium]MBU1533785.1 response regulator [Myxococcota bacterium]
MGSRKLTQDEVRELIGYCKSLQLLYVETSMEEREANMPMLSQFFGRIVVASDVVEGFEHFRRYPIDIVLTGVRIPNGNGIGLIRQIRQRNPHVTVLVISKFLEPSYFH